ncbi:YbaB/EbfC family nucleoid-associated protein [Micromonospora sp. DR5-3]|uniref:YbaB/EbfC family nucleoid-associated protein n=1 Tax=unclassified Micromonospora TaxID=2617518 RepID=UPI0016525A34|nr:MULTISPECIES: YbaB/EbfC family nucleoid-associated protein [unclassified Micromonospora]MCW3817247.1 YbaB/EbfC family nucleoid-associated protein [Micromonospora sp. DR5-3]
MEPQAIAERARRIREAVAAASTELTSEDHAVTVVVGPGGAVRELHLSSRAFRYPGAELGELVVRTIREANLVLQRDLAETLSELTGGRTRDPFAPLPTAAQLRAELDKDEDAGA